MKVRSLSLLALMLLAAPASAHIKLTEPMGWRVTNNSGDPQKTGPCGNEGNAAMTNVVHRVKPGDKIRVVWRETVAHPGHFRVSIAADRAQFKDPVITRVGDDACGMATKEANPQLPTLVDNLFPSTAMMPRAGRDHMVEITVPDMSCPKCTVQLLQYMSNHAAPCFYYQCFDVQISNEGGDGGVTVVVDAAADTRAVDAAASIDARGTGGSTGTGGTTGTGGSGGAMTGTGGSGQPMTTGGAGGRPSATAGAGGSATSGTGGSSATAGTGGGSARKSDGGCAMNGGEPSLGALVLLALAILLARRRSRRA